MRCVDGGSEEEKKKKIMLVDYNYQYLNASYSMETNPSECLLTLLPVYQAILT